MWARHDGMPTENMIRSMSGRVERPPSLEVQLPGAVGGRLQVFVLLDRPGRVGEPLVELGLLDDRQVVGHVRDRPLIELVRLLPR